MPEKQLRQTATIHQNSPLWQRVPSRDDNGKAYADFMMLLPGFNQLQPAIAQDYLNRIERCLQTFDDNVVYVDLNSRLNILWISHKPAKGITSAIVNAVQQQVPGAKVIAAEYQSNLTDHSQPKRLKVWMNQIRLGLQRSLLLTRKP